MTDWLNDKYGRSTKPYEDSKFEESKDDKCLWIEDVEAGDSNMSFSNCKLVVETIDDLDVINNKKDDDLIMFLKGGMDFKMLMIKIIVLVFMEMLDTEEYHKKYLINWIV